MRSRAAPFGSVSEARYRDLLTTARDGQVTMLRIWGGGIYEHDVFYGLCDELGLLVWQDFAFACIDYPDDDLRLRTEVEQEAAYQVRRLRNHACLALWCGNNEVQMIHAVRRIHHDQPGRRAQVRHRALSAPGAALQRNSDLAVQRRLARL